MSWLAGRKTYLGSIALGVLGLAYSVGWITEDQLLSIGAIVGAMTGASLRAAVKKAER